MHYSLTPAVLGAIASTVVLSNGCHAYSVFHMPNLSNSTDIAHQTLQPDNGQHVGHASPTTFLTKITPPAPSVIGQPSQPKSTPAIGGPGKIVIVQDRRTVNVHVGTKVVGGFKGGFFTVNGGHKYAIFAGAVKYAGNAESDHESSHESGAQKPSNGTSSSSGSPTDIPKMPSAGPSGQKSTGPKPSGPKPTSVPTDPNTTNPDSTDRGSDGGSNSEGHSSTGPAPTGPEPSGTPKPAGPKPTGSSPGLTGPKPSGPEPNGPSPTGPNPAGPNPSGSKTNDSAAPTGSGSDSSGRVITLTSPLHTVNRRTL